MGFIKYQRGKAGEHVHVYVQQPDGRMACACGAPAPKSKE